MNKNDEVLLTALPEMARSLAAYGNGLMRGLMQVSGGASVSLLAFIGYLMVGGLVSEAKSFVWPLALFCTAALMACAGFGFSYLSHDQSWNARHCLLSGERDFAEQFEKRANNWLIGAVLVVILAFVFCLAGIWLGYRAFMSL